MIQVDVLGPLRVSTDEGGVAVPGAKQRLLAAMLAAGGGEPVGTPVLVEALWPEQRPQDPQHALQNLVSRLRKLLGPDAASVRRHADGYRFDENVVRIDAVHYRQMVEEARRARDAGRTSEALELLTTSEGLWRGRPFQDVPEATALAAEAASLQQLRRVAHDQRFDLALATGHHAQVLEELRGLVLGDPLDERRTGQLMLALARTGRHAEALAVYERVRRTLQEELGVDPSPQLQQLHVGVLRGSTEVVEAPLTSISERPEIPEQHGALPAPLVPSSRQPLVGRGPQMSSLTDLWAEAAAGSGRLVLLEGEPGAGKTRLLAAIAEHVRTRRSIVLFGRCDEDATVPYQPFAESLGGLEHDDPEDSVSSRRALFDRTLDELAALGAEAPVLLLIDDLHWATTPTLLLLRHIVRWGSTLPLLVVATLRDRGAEIDPTETAVLAELQAEPSVHRLAVGALALADIRQLLEELGGDLGSASDVHRRTGGNAFLVGELLRERSGAREAHAEFGGVPQRVNALVRARRARLSAAANLLLDCAAVAGESFDLRVIGPASELDEPELADAIDEAMSAGFLELRSGTRSCAFVHALVRETVLNGLNPVRRRQLHRGVADALETVERHRIDEVAAALSHHNSEALRWSSARTYATLAGDFATRAYAWEDAAAHYRRAVEANRRSDDPVPPAPLLLKLADSERRGANSATALSVYREAFEAARDDDIPRALAMAALGFEDTRGEETFEDHAGPSRAMLRTALEELGNGDPDLEAHLLARLAIAEAQHGAATDQPAALAERALDHARSTGDPTLLATALEGSYWVHWTASGLDERLAITAELQDVAQQLDDRRVLRARVLRASACLEAGDRDAFERALAGYEADAQRVAEPWYLWWVRAFDGTRAIIDGDLERLGAVIGDLAPLVQGRQQFELVGLFSTVLALEHGRRNQYPALIDGWTSALEEGDTDPSNAHAALALITALAGDTSEASHHIERVSFDYLATRPSGSWGLAFTGLAAAELGDRARAYEVHQRLVPYPRRVVLIGLLTPFTTTSYVLCRLAEVLDDLTAAVGHAQDAVGCSEAMGAVTWVARAKYHHARLLFRDSPLHDHATATDLADRAAREARRAGMHGLQDLAVELMESGPAA